MRKIRQAIGVKSNQAILPNDTEPECIRKTVEMASESNNTESCVTKPPAESNTLTTTGSSTNLATTPAKAASVSPGSQKKKRRVTELQCGEIRWFVKKEGESKWTPLKGYDSLIIEVAWRRRNDIAIDPSTALLLDEIPKTENVIVLDGLYMLDENSEKLDSVYWKDESIPLRRGFWFHADNMQPLAMDLATAIEKHHLQSFKDQSIPEGPVFSDTESSKRPVLTSLNWDEHEEIRWNSVIDIVWYNNSKASKFIRFVTRSKGTVLKRGYSEEAQIGDGRPNFSDLILVVHGIGQKGYETLIAKNTGQIREAIQYIMDKSYPNEQRRPMILPIEWRSSLKLDNGLTDVITLPRMPGVRQAMNASAMDIMYYQSPLYRSEIINGVIGCLNSTYDLFMKNNPGFGGKISILAHSLGSVITYDIFANWSPLLLYDEFVTNAIEEQLNNTSISEEERNLLETFYQSRKKLFEDEQKMRAIVLRREEPLHFTIEHLFSIGSPLAVFLVMRGIDYTKVIPKSSGFKFLYNIFHPYDPVAYRLEPLYDEHYRYVRPMKLFSYSDERARKPYANTPYDLHKSYLRKLKKEQKNKDKEATKGEKEVQEAGNTKVPPELPPPPTAHSRSWWQFGGSATSPAPPNQEEIEIAKEADSGGSACSSHSPIPPPPQPEVKKQPLTTVEALVGQIKQERRLQSNIPGPLQRLDFFIQPGVMDKSYISMLKSHFGYWQSYDLIGFIVNTLYPQQEPALSTK
ncbi:hypothetical protein FO519_001359 [Halicephalobus sp. NKZ332]|nr:hypothetical protein FO519_001359 [Halicephalobus sp. NKZ332]